MPPTFNPEMPEVIVTNTAIVQITPRGSLLGQLVEQTFYYKVGVNAADITTSVIVPLLAKFETDVLDKMIDCVSDQMVYDTILGTNLTDNRVAPGTRVVAPAAGQGTRTGDPLAPQNAITCGRKTGIAGRHGRGSIRLAGISEDDQTAGILTGAGLLTALDLLVGTTLLQTLAITVAAVNYDFIPVLATSTFGETPVVRASNIIQWTYHTAIRSQRTRTRYDFGS